MKTSKYLFWYIFGFFFILFFFDRNHVQTHNQIGFWFKLIIIIFFL